MAKTRSKELKVGRGVSLAEAKWEQLAEVAEAQDRSPSQVIDEALTQYFATVRYFRKSGVESRNTGLAELELGDDDFDAS